MARFEFRGIEKYINKLDTFRLVTKDSVIARTTYAGAAVVADAVRKSIEALPVGSGRSEDGGLIDTVTAAQKRGLLDGFGISPMRDDNGFINVKLGFDGYNATRTKSIREGSPMS